MRVSWSFALCVAAACHGPAPRADVPLPDYAVVAEWPAGQRFTAALADGAPDQPTLRAAAVWWQEALRQSAAFSLAPDAVAGLPRLELRVDRDGAALTAVLVDGARRAVLAAAPFADDAALPGAIDRVAWTARLALGEQAPPPQPVAAVTSPDADVVVAVHEARALVDVGSLQAGYRALKRARQRDGGAPFVLQPLASCELLFGRAPEAERICREAIGYERRSSPTTAHLLGRTLLLAQAARHPVDVARYDQRLHDLAVVGARERPHDDEVRYTAALADNYRGAFAASAALLTELAERQPEHAFVRYHLGWARLATGDPDGAAAALQAAALRIPSAWVLLPRAIALFEHGDHEALARLLRETLEEHPDDAVLPHQVLRMQAAHALLQGDGDRARALLADDLVWLAEHPTTLEQRAGEFAECGELLVRLGGDDRLPALLVAAQQLRAGTAIADACAYISGLLQVRRAGAPSDGLVERLRRGGESTWALRLEAFVHEQRGEVADMQTALARAARLSSSPMAKALLARSLRAVGKHDEAQALERAVTRELLTIDLRQPCQHPLYGPELAYPYLLCRGSAEQQ